MAEVNAGQMMEGVGLLRGMAAEQQEMMQAWDAWLAQVDPGSDWYRQERDRRAKRAEVLFAAANALERLMPAVELAALAGLTVGVAKGAAPELSDLELLKEVPGALGDLGPTPRLEALARRIAHQSLELGKVVSKVEPCRFEDRFPEMSVEEMLRREG